MNATVPGWELPIDHGAYPECLRLSPRPPVLLRGIGDATALRPGLAVIGSRRATPYGLSCARAFAGWAAQQGVVIVSGAAVGCDMAAHDAALEADGMSVAVLGCGADVDYPRSAAGLLGALRSRGVVVSELPWGAPPLPRHFPERNRIIAGLAAVVLVVEAGLPSGTFTTADHALDAGRTVVAVPGSIHSPTSRGCNRLIHQGARPITGVTDLAEELVAAGLLPLTSGTSTTPHGVAARTLAPQVARLLAALAADPMRPDDACRALAVDVVPMTRMLGGLETQGLIERFPDGRYGVARPW